METADSSASRRGSSVDNPAVSGSTSVLDAAASHLARYGGALGLDARGTELVGATIDPVGHRPPPGALPPAGRRGAGARRRRGRQHPARPRARVDAGHGDRRHVGASGTRVRRAGSREGAGRRWRGRRRSTGVAVARPGPLAVRPDGLRRTGAGWARARSGGFEATDGAGFRRLVLVDDRSGRVLLNIDLIASIDRVVCDNANVPAVRRRRLHVRLRPHRGRPVRAASPTSTPPSTLGGAGLDLLPRTSPAWT